MVTTVLVFLPDRYSIYNPEKNYNKDPFQWYNFFFLKPVFSTIKETLHLGIKGMILKKLLMLQRKITEQIR